MRRPTTARIVIGVLTLSVVLSGCNSGTEGTTASAVVSRESESTLTGIYDPDSEDGAVETELVTICPTGELIVVSHAVGQTDPADAGEAVLDPAAKAELEEAEAVLSAMAGITVEEGPLQIKLTLPEEVDPDGSGTYTFDREDYNRLLREMHRDISDQGSRLIAEGTYPSWHRCTINGDISLVTIEVEAAQWHTWEQLGAMSFIFDGWMYQVYSGVPADEAGTVVQFLNRETGELIIEMDRETLAGLEVVPAG